MSLVARVVRLAAGQFHLVGRRDLRELGASRRWVLDNVRSGLLSPAVEGVHGVGVDIGSFPRDTCAMLGLLRTSSPSALYRETAAERLGIWSRGPSDVHVASTGRNGGTCTGLCPDVAVHAYRVARLPSADLVVAGGMPTTCAARTIIDLGHVLDPLQLAHVIWNAIYAELVDLRSLGARLDAMPRARGTAAVRAAVGLLAAGSCGTKSRSEDELIAIVRRAGLPEPVVNVLGSAGLPGGRLDFVWPDQGMVFELDGRHHAAMPGIAASDRSVMQLLRSQGWTTLRAHYSKVWRDPMGTALRLATALDR